MFGANTAYQKLLNQVADLALVEPTTSGTPIPEYLNKFTEVVNDDLNLPVAISVVWRLLDDHSILPADTLATIIEFDKVLGLDLNSATQPLELPPLVKQLLTDREVARQAGDFTHADTLRQQIEANGYIIEDTAHGPKLRKT